MNLEPRVCYRALKSRDARFDGRFFVGVTSTGVYCRPVCPARTPLRRNCTFHRSAASAEEAGFRPCLRCRPETSPGTPAWIGTSATVSRAMRLIREGALVDAGVDELADRLGVGARHLRRLFEEHLGASPIAIEQTRRVQFAKRLLDDTVLPVTQIAFTAGFGSVRRFNTAVRNVYGRSPRDLRRERHGSRGDSSGIVLRLGYRPPFHWNQIIDFLSPRAVRGVERVDADEYARAVTIGEFCGVARVRPGSRNALELRVPAAAGAVLADLVPRFRELFDLDCDPAAIDRVLGEDGRLRSAVAGCPGLRVPGCWDRFELAVRAVLGQQVTVRGATTLVSRLVERFGEPIDSGAEGIDRLFPRPDRLSRARIEAIGVPAARARALRALAGSVSSGDLRLDAPRGLEDAVHRLCALPGIGPWTAQYIAMRALREPDAFPAGDLVVRKALADEAGLPAAPRADEISQAWRPWRSYAVFHLWMNGANSNGVRR